MTAKSGGLSYKTWELQKRVRMVPCNIALALLAIIFLLTTMPPGEFSLLRFPERQESTTLDLAISEPATANRINRQNSELRDFVYVFASRVNENVFKTTYSTFKKLCRRKDDDAAGDNDNDKLISNAIETNYSIYICTTHACRCVALLMNESDGFTDRTQATANVEWWW